MMRGITVTVGDCFTGRGRAYIYILFSKVHRVAYVGQTNDKNGAIGRLCSHVSTKGTLRYRLLETLGVQLDDITDLCLFSFRLPIDNSYVGTESSFREGVEYIVQRKLRGICGSMNPNLRLVSHVRYSDAASILSVQKVAEEIFETFLTNYQNQNL